MKQSTVAGARSNKDELNFAALAKEIGYVKARQQLKKIAVQAHQVKVSAIDATALEKKASLRLKVCECTFATFDAS